jgi:putative N6-adenine-specific DNA methylase
MAELPDTLFAATLPGLEEVTASELRELRMRRVRVQPGGVAFQGDAAAALQANLWLRTASFVLMRLTRFRARHLAALVTGAEAVAWRRLLPAGAPLTVRATCRKSRLQHSGAVAERVAGVVGSALGLSVRDAGADRVSVGPEPDPASPETRVRVRLYRDEVILSLDTSGDPLHRRGYRLETAKAPLRETLAAALLRLVGWSGERPLMDPCCGAGTIVIEAALRAARMPPGAGRRFAMERWPGLDPDCRATLEAAVRRRPVRVALRGTDRDAGAVAAARHNAERAGVAAFVQFEKAPLSEVQTPAPAGLLACNPPYGKRLGARGSPRNLYATLGACLRVAPPGWDLALITDRPALARATGLALTPCSPPLPHGGLKVRIYATVPRR